MNFPIPQFACRCMQTTQGLNVEHAMVCEDGIGKLMPLSAIAPNVTLTDEQASAIDIVGCADLEDTTEANAVMVCAAGERKLFQLANGHSIVNCDGALKSRPVGLTSFLPTTFSVEILSGGSYIPLDEGDLLTGDQVGRITLDSPPSLLKTVMVDTTLSVSAVEGDHNFNVSVEGRNFPIPKITPDVVSPRLSPYTSMKSVPALGGTLNWAVTVATTPDPVTNGDGMLYSLDFNPEMYFTSPCDTV